MTCSSNRAETGTIAQVRLVRNDHDGSGYFAFSVLIGPTGMAFGVAMGIRNAL
jgi:hypothetical protein